MSRFVVCWCVTLVAAGNTDLVAQEYILRPGPRGFDSQFNRYGATERPSLERPQTKAGEISQTNLKVELLIEANGPRVDAQQWSQKLADLGYPARIRSPLLDDKIDVSETTRGPLRFVTVVGSLDRRGNLVFPDRSFTAGQTDELKEWLDDLKKYGAQGSPEGQPMWGLTRPQFEQVYGNLSRPVAADVAGLSLFEGLAMLNVPREHPLRWNVAAKQTLDELPFAKKTIARSCEGLTTGTALAFVLNEYGLGFRPERLPEGTIGLSIEPLPEKAAAQDEGIPVLWPIGWSLKEDPTWERGRKPVRDQDAEPPSRVQLAPSLFAMTEIGMQKVPLRVALATLEEKTGVPVLIDSTALEGAKVDLNEAQVNFPPRRMSWSQALRGMTFTHRLQGEIRRDEAGNPLIWVSPLKVGR